MEYKLTTRSPHCVQQVAPCKQTCLYGALRCITPGRIEFLVKANSFSSRLTTIFEGWRTVPALHDFRVSNRFLKMILGVRLFLETMFLNRRMPSKDWPRVGKAYPQPSTYILAWDWDSSKSWNTVELSSHLLQRFPWIHINIGPFHTQLTHFDSSLRWR